MTDFFKMDVFFVVATIATVVIAVIAVVALVYAVLFLRTMNRISEEIEEEAIALRRDIEDVRSRVRGFRFTQLFALFGKPSRKRTKK